MLVLGCACLELVRAGVILKHLHAQWLFGYDHFHGVPVFFSSLFTVGQNIIKIQHLITGLV